MTVEECISRAKDSSSVKIDSIWICPDVVSNGKVGKNYVYTGSIESRVPTDLKTRKTKKYWTEDGCLCVVYVAEGQPIVVSSS